MRLYFGETVGPTKICVRMPSFESYFYNLLIPLLSNFQNAVDKT